MMAAASRLLVAFAVACGICACGGEKDNVAEDASFQVTEDDVVKCTGHVFDSMMGSWEPVWLEDSEAALLGEVRYVVYDDGLLFIVSSSNYSENTVMVFDKEGNFMNRVGNIGNARNEYRYLNSLAVDPLRKEVVLLTGYPSTLKYYNYKGGFLRSVDVDMDGYDGDISPDMGSVCLPDGSLLVSNMMGVEQNDDYILIHADGSVEPLLERRDYKVSAATPDGIEIGGHFHVGLTNHYYDPHADPTWFLRRFDNHLYHMEGSDSASCVANLAYVPEIPEDMKCSFPVFSSNRTSGGMLSLAIDTRDYVVVEFDGEYSFIDKRAMRAYKGDSNVGSEIIPASFFVGCSDNVIIGEISTTMAEEMYEYRSDLDTDPNREITGFYKKVSGRDNPVLVLCRIKDPEDLHSSIDGLN